MHKSDSANQRFSVILKIELARAVRVHAKRTEQTLKDVIQNAVRNYFASNEPNLRELLKAESDRLSEIELVELLKNM